MGPITALLLAWQTQPALSLEAILDRLSEEAEAFANLAPKMVGEETLEHQGRRSPPRFRPRVGAKAAQAPAVPYLKRTIVSEYGFGTVRENPGDLREFRKVVSVDGREVLAVHKARLALAVGMNSEDDRARKQMLQAFERHGTLGATSDIGQLILLFRRGALSGYDFTLGPSREDMLVVRYRQKAGKEQLRVYQDNEMVRQPLEGEIWVRPEDGLPLRITFNARTDEHKRKAIHSASVAYQPSKFGLLLPSEVRYTKHVEGELMVENTARYSVYQMFRVEADIKFTPEEDAPKP